MKKITVVCLMLFILLLSACRSSDLDTVDVTAENNQKENVTETTAQDSQTEAMSEVTVTVSQEDVTGVTTSDNSKDNETEAIVEDDQKDKSDEATEEIGIKEEGAQVSDSEIADQVNKIQQIISIGINKDEALSILADNYELLELYNASGDSYKEAYLIVHKSSESTLKVHIGDIYDDGMVKDQIIKIDGDSFWIEKDDKERSINYNIYNDVIAFRNCFLVTRKIGMTAKIFINQDNQVNGAWIEFVYGEKNNVHSIHYGTDGHVVLTLEDKL